MVTIPRLQRLIPITESDGTPTLAFHTWWDQVAKSIEDAFTSLADQVAAIAAAEAAATAAMAQADIARRNDKISASLTAPTSILTAADLGGATGASITIANHTRKYGDATTVAITGATLSPLLYTTTYAIYYDDVTCSVTTPTFIATTTLANGQPNAAAGRHYCGQITTPASGGVPTGGGGPRGTGGGGPYP